MRTAPSSRREPALHTSARRELKPATCLQEFFKPKQVVYVAEKKWGDTERDKLYEARRGRASAPRSRQRAAARKPSPATRRSATRSAERTRSAAAQGLEKYGIGSWREIRAQLLPDVCSRLSCVLALKALTCCRGSGTRRRCASRHRG